MVFRAPQMISQPVWYGCLFSSHDESRAEYNLTEPLSLQVKHVAVEFVEPFRPSRPYLRTMKTFAQWCRVGTSYFTHSWETREGRERLPSRIGPKDRPTAQSKTKCWPKERQIIHHRSKRDSLAHSRTKCWPQRGQNFFLHRANKNVRRQQQ